MDLGRKATLSFTVEEQDTAASLGSGDLAVLGTPRLLAWCEAATVSAIAADLTATQSSVGTRVSFKHLFASPLGAVVSVTATIAHIDGRLIRFEVVGQHEDTEKVIAHAEITRVVVDRDRFLSRLNPSL